MMVKMLFQVAVIIFLLYDANAHPHPHWSYQGRYDPEAWTDLPHNEACGRRTQSPIDLIIPASGPTNPGSLEFDSYKCPEDSTPFSLVNNGHSAQVNLPSDSQARLIIGENSYKLVQFHFHWGSSSNRGSEHTFNSQRYAAEIHFVHVLEEYNSISEALEANLPHGLAVVGGLIEDCDEINEAYEPFITKLREIRESGSETTLDAFDLTNLFPEHSGQPLTLSYYGSLTTPPCSEVVLWNVFLETIKLSTTQLEAFRSLRTSDGEALINNYRPLQPLNGRELKWNIYQEYD